MHSTVLRSINSKDLNLNMKFQVKAPRLKKIESASEQVQGPCIAAGSVSQDPLPPASNLPPETVNELVKATHTQEPEVQEPEVQHTAVINGGHAKREDARVSFKDGAEINKLFKVLDQQSELCICWLAFDKTSPVISWQTNEWTFQCMQKLGEDVGKLCPPSPDLNKKRRGKAGKQQEEMDLRLRLKESWGDKVCVCICMYI